MSREIEELRFVVHEQNKIISNLIDQVEKLFIKANKYQESQGEFNNSVAESNTAIMKAVLKIQKDIYGENKEEIKEVKKTKLTIVKP